MTGFVPKEKLTAYQRWEVAAFDEAEAAAHVAQPASRAATDAQSEESGEALVLPTAAAVERMYADAHKEGYAAGRAEGAAETRAHAERIAAVMNGVHQSLRELDQHVAEQLLATAVEIANQILRQSLRVKPELLLPVIRDAVATLNAHLGHPAIFVHPDDAALIRTHLGEQLAHNSWRLIEDNALTPGGCRVELGASEVDATLETRWRRVLEAIGISQEWLVDKP